MSLLFSAFSLPPSVPSLPPTACWPCDGLFLGGAELSLFCHQRGWYCRLLHPSSALVLIHPELTVLLEHDVVPMLGELSAGW